MPTTRPWGSGNQAAQLRNNCGSKPDSQEIHQYIAHLSKRVGSQAVNFGYLMLHLIVQPHTHRRRIHGPGWQPFHLLGSVCPTASVHRRPLRQSHGRLVQRVLGLSRCARQRIREGARPPVGPSSTIPQPALSWGQDSCEQLLFVPQRFSANNLRTQVPHQDGFVLSEAS